MKERAIERRKHAAYCKEHLEEFRFELRDAASTVLSRWPGRSFVVLMVVSSLVNYFVSEDNPYSNYLLFSYSVPICIILLFPLSTFVFSTLDKFSQIAIDSLFFTGMLSYCLTLYLIFLGAGTEEELRNLYLPLSGQVNFLLLLVTTFSYHARYKITFLRNVVFTIVFAYSLFVIDAEFFYLNQLQLLQGICAGTIMSWIFFETIRTRFYLKSTDADARQHLYNQLSKLVYPHQLERIKLGDELESTMPLKESKAIINVFDVQRSSEIKHEKTQEFFMNLFQVFLQICMQGYEHNPLRSQAFRLKETGDGFISSVGYPFLPVGERSLADSAVSAALIMFESFNREVEKFNYSRPIKGAMGLAYNSVQGTFQSGGIRSYDLFGEALIQASKYEEIRKIPEVWEIMSARAREMGLDHFNLIVAQEVVYNSLSPAYRDLFNEIDLASEELANNDFKMMYDHDAKYIYYHILP